MLGHLQVIKLFTINSREEKLMGIGICGVQRDLVVYWIEVF
jgi:hypothetical protein